MGVINWCPIMNVNDTPGIYCRVLVRRCPVGCTITVYTVKEPARNQITVQAWEERTLVLFTAYMKNEQVYAGDILRTVEQLEESSGPYK